MHVLNSRNPYSLVLDSYILYFESYDHLLVFLEYSISNFEEKTPKKKYQTGFSECITD